MYKKIKTKFGDRMIGVDEDGRITYEGIREFISINPGFEMKTICDSSNVYRVLIRHIMIPAFVEEIGEASTATLAYELAISKAFKRLMELEVPFYFDDSAPTDAPVTKEIADENTRVLSKEIASVEKATTTKKSEKVEKTEKKPEIEVDNSKPVEPKNKIQATQSETKVENSEVTDTKIEDTEVEDTKVEPNTLETENEVTTITVDMEALENTVISIGQQLSKNPKTIKELWAEEKDKPNLGMIGFIARKVKMGPNIEQANKVREYLEANNIDY